MVSWEPSFFSNNLHNKRVSYFLVVDNGKTSYTHHLPVRLAGRLFCGLRLGWVADWLWINLPSQKNFNGYSKGQFG